VTPGFVGNMNNAQSPPRPTAFAQVHVGTSSFTFEINRGGLEDFPVNPMAGD
jgi:hypothetical protein